MDAMTMGLLIERLTEIRDDQRKLIRMLEENRQEGHRYHVSNLRRSHAYAVEAGDFAAANRYADELADYERANPTTGRDPS